MLKESKLVETALKMHALARKNVPWFLFYWAIATVGIYGLMGKTELMARCEGYEDGVRDSLLLLGETTEESNSN